MPLEGQQTRFASMLFHTVVIISTRIQPPPFRIIPSTPHFPWHTFHAVAQLVPVGTGLSLTTVLLLSPECPIHGTRLHGTRLHGTHYIWVGVVLAAQK